MGYCFVLLLCPCSIYAQNSNTDSLLTVVKNSPPDTLKVDKLLEIASKIGRNDPDRVINISDTALRIAEQLQYENGVAYAYKSIGLGYFFQSDNVNAMVNWQKSLNYFTEIGNKQGQSNILNNLGAVYYNGGDDTKAVDFYIKSLIFCLSRR